MTWKLATHILHEADKQRQEHCDIANEFFLGNTLMHAEQEYSALLREMIVKIAFMLKNYFVPYSISL